MKNLPLRVDKFFDISSFPFADIFDVQFPWQALDSINHYIELFSKRGIMKENFEKRGLVFIGKGSKVHPAAEIMGPAIIGNNCYIGHAALLREGCILGNNVNIGHGSEVKHAIILNDSALAHLNYVGDSVIGNKVRIGGGAIVANARLDRKPIVIRNGDEKIETGLKRLGVVIGDGSKIGVNAVLNPGTLLGKNCTVYPLTSVAGVYEEGENIK